MSKKRFEKRRLKAKKKRNQQQRKPAARPTSNTVPSAPTMWRTMHLDKRTQEMVMTATIQYQPSVLARDAKKTLKVENAVDLEALLDLTPTASGIAEPAWYRRIQEFGPTAARSIAEHLCSDWMLRHAKDRSAIQERCIGALRWCGEDGADALLTCWDSLDDYGRSIACIALGLLGTQRSGDHIWDFFQKVQDTRESLFVGPLWGLIDLKDRRAPGALATFLDTGREFYEMYGFISRAGDSRFILPLIGQTMLGPDNAKGEAMWALTGIAHRIGREALAEELRNSPEPRQITESDIESSLDKIFKYSVEDVERHFEVFYDTNGGRQSSRLRWPKQTHALRFWCGHVPSRSCTEPNCFLFHHRASYMQQQLDQPFTEQDLERLDHFLADEEPEDSMGLDELHGFLMALICSSQVILPSQWIPVVWGDQEPEFANMDQAQDITGMMMRLNNDVASWLADGIFEPLFMEETLANGHVVLDPHGWCEGFVRGMQLQPDAWRDDELNEALMPIIVLSDTIKDDPKINELLDDDEAIEKLAEVVPEAVVSIFRHQRQHFASPSETVKRSGPKVGRNDPCPWGSGKKHKKCCGSATLH